MRNEFYRNLRKAYKTKKKKKELWELAISYYLKSINHPKPDNLWENFKKETIGKSCYKAGKKYLREKYQYCCYCQEKFITNHNLHIDHVLPKSIYPYFTFEPNNLAPACGTCNVLKGTEDYFNVENFGECYDNIPLALNFYHPIFHVFNEHVELYVKQTNDFYVRAYFATTKIGRDLYSNHLYKITNFSIKSKSNPTVLESINKLNKLLLRNDFSNNEAIRYFTKNLIENI